VNLKLLICCHGKKRLHDVWYSRVSHLLENNTVSFKLNGNMGSYFHNYEGVHQGDPMSPTLFNLDVECGAKMVLRARSTDLFVRLAVDHFFDTK
jgi:hypothetical protein